MPTVVDIGTAVGAVAEFLRSADAPLPMVREVREFELYRGEVDAGPVTVSVLPGDTEYESDWPAVRPYGEAEIAVVVEAFGAEGDANRSATMTADEVVRRVVRDPTLAGQTYRGQCWARPARVEYTSARDRVHRVAAIVYVDVRFVAR